MFRVVELILFLFLYRISVFCFLGSFLNNLFYTLLLVNNLSNFHKFSKSWEEDTKQLYPISINTIQQSKFNSGIDQFIYDKQEVKIHCNTNPQPFQYCQPHYLLCWDSISRNYSLFHIQSFDREELSVDYSIVLHSSVNRLRYLNDITQRWTGPISLALFVQMNETMIVDKWLKNLHHSNLRLVLYVIPENETNCIYRSIMNHTHCIPISTSIYPINTLRNLAIQNIHTSHFLNLDMDMWPSYGLYEELKRLNKQQVMEDKIAFVLPAFQFTPEVRKICLEVNDCLLILKERIPINKTSLLSCMRSKTCQIANARLPTHRFITKEWWEMKDPIQYLECIPFSIMEPYVLLSRTIHTPLYNENFINYGYNKVQYIDHLQYIGYSFHVLTIGFGFDIPHKPSIYANQYEQSWKDNQVINADVYQHFLSSLHKQQSMRKQLICNKENALKVFRAEF